MKGSKRRGRGTSRNEDKSDNLPRFNGNFTYEPSDSEDDYSQQEKMLLEKVRSHSSRSKAPKKEAVLDLPSEEEDNDENDNGGNYDMEDDDGENDSNLDSDIEGKEDNSYLPDQRAWGKSRKNFYNTDYVDQDYGGFEGDDAEAAEREEQEAREIQKRLAAELDDNDFTLDVFTKSKEDTVVSEKPAEEIIKTDLSQLSSRQKIALLEKECPELLGIISEFRDAVKELKELLQPAISLVHNNQVSSPELAQFIRTKYHLTSNYVMNMSFYLLLRAKRLPVSAHPIVKRILQYRQLLQQLEPLNSATSDMLESLLNAAKDGSLPAILENGAATIKPTKKLFKFASEDEAMEEAMSDTSDDELESMKKLKQKEKLKDTRKSNQIVNSEKSSGNDSKKREIQLPWENTLDSEEKDVPWAESLDLENKEEDGNSESGVPDGTEDNEDDRRTVPWQISKNKGLVPRRKKELRNPRVKNRNKYKKAVIRRKGQVRQPRTELQRYGGEISGIKKTVTKSIKLK